MTRTGLPLPSHLGPGQGYAPPPPAQANRARDGQGTAREVCKRMRNGKGTGFTGVYLSGGGGVLPHNISIHWSHVLSRGWGGTPVPGPMSLPGGIPVPPVPYGRVSQSQTPLARTGWDTPPPSQDRLGTLPLPPPPPPHHPRQNTRASTYYAVDLHRTFLFYIIFQHSNTQLYWASRHHITTNTMFY